jgi:hypothetical protein
MMSEFHFRRRHLDGLSAPMNTWFRSDTPGVSNISFVDVFESVSTYL